MNNDSFITASEALSAALEYAGLSHEEAMCTFTRRDAGLYELGFRTDWLKYDCYIDAQSAEVLGFNFEPIPDTDKSEYQSGGVFWNAGGRNIAANR